MVKLTLRPIVAAIQSLVPSARIASANGTGVDLQGFDSALCVVSVGACTDGTHTPKLQDSPDNSTWSDVVAAQLDGAFTAITTANANTVQAVGYIGGQRYVRAVMTVAGATTGGVMEAAILRGNPRHV